MRFVAHARGALLGLAVGDAMGSTCEFNVWAPHPKYPKLATGITEPVGGGPFMLAKGQTTDDTQLATVLASFLFTHNRWSEHDLALGYVAWRRHAFDIGSQTTRAIANLKDALIADSGDLRGLVRSSTAAQAAGNGAMMRAGAIGAWTLATGRAGKALDVAAWDCELTHANPSAMIANVAYVASVELAAMSPGESGKDVLARALAVANLWLLRTGALERYAQGEVKAACAEMRETYKSAFEKNPRRAGGGGWCHTSLALAWWHLARDTSYQDAITDLANRGGDADTNCAIAGALLGARWGDRAIPFAWLRTVLTHTPRHDDSTLALEYHPRRLLELLPQTDRTRRLVA